MKPTECAVCGNLALGSEYCYKCNRYLDTVRLAKDKEDAARAILQTILPDSCPSFIAIEDLVKHLEIFIQAELATRDI